MEVFGEHPVFRFVTATRKGFGDGTLPLVKCLNKMTAFVRPNNCCDIDYKIAYNNSDGLPIVYNKAISDALNDGVEYLILLHDDIWVNDVLIFDKLLNSAKFYDVIGVCGGKAWSFNRDDRPIIWTHASQGKGMSGFMAHAADEAQSSVKYEHTYDGRSIFSSNYGNSPSKTLTLDGCFMCLTKKAMDSGLRFDEQFKFHFYDMDLCFSAYVKGISVGTAPILLTHESLGMSVAQPEFMDSQRKFLDKWFERKK